MPIQKIMTYLWFDSQAEEAATFYTSIFNNSKILNVARYPEGAPGMAGTAMTVEFQLEGQQFIALNGGPQFKFNEAISLLVNCDTQEEVDRLWRTLTDNGGEEQPCGWLKDKFGLSWQIIPTELGTLLSDPDPAKAQRAMNAMLQTKKIDVQVLRDAAKGC
jgi:predicted 3-demethylubiquinone-9 3-methyltransferase (glyoxalase superfamily)